MRNGPLWRTVGVDGLEADGESVGGGEFVDESADDEGVEVSGVGD
jgi:hypothetical protein